MVISGTLQYPGASMFGQTFDQAQPRQYIRSFIQDEGATIANCSIVIDGDNLSTAIYNDKLLVYLYNAAQDNSDYHGWKNITYWKIQSGGTSIRDWIHNPFISQKKISMDIQFDSSTAVSRIYLKILMKPGCTAKINKIYVNK